MLKFDIKNNLLRNNITLQNINYFYKIEKTHYFFQQKTT